jgi:hypothetical protein
LLDALPLEIELQGVPVTGVELRLDEDGFHAVFLPVKRPACHE